VGTTEGERPTHVEQTITAFADQKPGWTTEIKAGTDATMDIVSTTPSSISSFLERPVRIADYTWAVGQPLFQKFNPWRLWCEDARVKEKMSHYALLRTKLHVKVVISGTGFHYGRALLAYNPWSSTDGLTVIRNFLEVDMVQASQRPHIFINPSTNSGGEMVLPFFYNHNYASLPRLDYRDLGEMYLKSFQDLQHANQGNDPVHITIYAWAEDLTLTMPTSEYSVQSGKRGAMNSGDEYGKGIISATASAVASAAGALTDAPLIGPYARATEVCARAGADVARHFGYSRPPVVSDIQLYKPNPTGNLANTDAADAVARLTLDSKQEITIDSRTVGLDGADQMDIKSIVTRESYLTQFNWAPTDTTDKLLWSSRVGPMLYRVEGVEIHPTPMSMIQTMFDQWQGSIKFRFQVVKSSFHKGRLLIRWDPRSNQANPEYNTTYSRVVDIAEEDDFEITIGWGQAEPFLNTVPMSKNPGVDFSSTGRMTDSFGRWNGVLEIDVINPLVSPAPDSAVAVNVFVSMCDDAKFGAPTAYGMNKLSLYPLKTSTSRASDSPYTPQSGVVESDAAPTNEMTDKPEEASAIQEIAPISTEVDQQYKVFFGEAVTSLRELFRRYTMSKVYTASSPEAPNAGIWDLSISALPYNYGFDPAGFEQYGPNDFQIVLANNGPISFMMPCYAGWRGGLRHKLVLQGKSMQRYAVAQRNGFYGYSNTVTPFPQDAASMQAALSRNFAQEGFAGMASTDRYINGVIETEIPYYNGKRMSSARLPSVAFNNGADYLKLSTLMVPPIAGTTEGLKNSVIYDHIAAGEDFSLFFFVGCPILYEYNIS
jgi:hypothetical protein